MRAQWCVISCMLMQSTGAAHATSACTHWPLGCTKRHFLGTFPLQHACVEAFRAAVECGINVTVVHEFLQFGAQSPCTSW